jgi:hypothetical protein
MKTVLVLLVPLSVLFALAGGGAWGSVLPVHP